MKGDLFPLLLYKLTFDSLKLLNKKDLVSLDFIEIVLFTRQLPRKRGYTYPYIWNSINGWTINYKQIHLKGLAFNKDNNHHMRTCTLYVRV